jgi:hypothetical protein
MKRAVIAAALTALAAAGAAHAEMPQNRGAPEVSGRAAVGWGVVGHNGTWLYQDGTACGAECLYSFAWERCNARGCRPIAGAINRVYKVRAVDVGSRFRVVVSATKYDCGEWNYAAGTQECRWVTSRAVSAETTVVQRPKRRVPQPRR